MKLEIKLLRLMRTEIILLCVCPKDEQLKLEAECAKHERNLKTLENKLKSHEDDIQAMKSELAQREEELQVTDYTRHFTDFRFGSTVAVTSKPVVFTCDDRNMWPKPRRSVQNGSR